MPRRPAQPDWDDLATRYNRPEFIASDPISFPHSFIGDSDWRNVECVAFLAALFSYGRREAILGNVHRILTPLGPQPVETLQSLTPKALQKEYKGFYYRFNKPEDLCFLLGRLGEVYREGGSLKALWHQVHPDSESFRHSIHAFRQHFLHGGKLTPPDTYGLKFLFADPGQNSAAKRFNMFLRWMVRQDAVDFGLWSDVLSPAELRFPLDTHVARMARLYGLTQRKSNDWQTVEDITTYFRKRCPDDPVRYDFALFGLGIALRENPLATGLTP